MFLHSGAVGAGVPLCRGAALTPEHALPFPAFARSSLGARDFGLLKDRLFRRLIASRFAVAKHAEIEGGSLRTWVNFRQSRVCRKVEIIIAMKAATKSSLCERSYVCQLSYCIESDAVDMHLVDGLSKTTPGAREHMLKEAAIFMLIHSYYH